MFKLKALKTLSICAVVLVLSACTTVNSKVGGLLDLDTDLTLSFVLDQSVNPDEMNESSPIIVRMYELTSTEAFENANFIDLFERDKEILNKTLVTHQRLKALKPGKNVTLNFVLSEKTKYIGLYAEFLKYKDAKYKVVIPVAQTNVVSSAAKIQLLNNRIIVL
jgi:type VI secretion system protein VasD